jgi:hypothetical protein
MKLTDKITAEGEEALSEVAHELEQIAEEIRGRGMRGHKVAEVAAAPGALRAQLQRLELLVHTGSA